MYIGGFVLVGLVFLVIAVVAVVFGFIDKTIDGPLAVLATALISGVLGGLFGYAKQ